MRLPSFLPAMLAVAAGLFQQDRILKATRLEAHRYGGQGRGRGRGPTYNPPGFRGIVPVALENKTTVGARWLKRRQLRLVRAGGSIRVNAAGWYCWQSV